MSILGDVLKNVSKPNLDTTSNATSIIPPATTKSVSGGVGGGLLGGTLSVPQNITASLGLQGKLNGVLGEINKNLPINLNIRLSGPDGKMGTFIKPSPQGKYSKEAGKEYGGNTYNPFAEGQYLRPTKFKTIINIPQKISAAHDAEMVSYSVQNCTIPGRRFATADTRRGTTLMHKMPYDVMYPEVTMTFQVTKHMKERQIFDMWQDIIYNPNNNVFGYFDDYKADVKIIQLDNATDEVRIYTLYDAYPIAVSDVQLAWDAFDQIETFTCSFVYKKWDAYNV